ncbi:hypothetical protein vseg_013300 [Gypsophila vaccaria]
MSHNKILDTQVAQLAASNSSRVPGSLPPQGVQPHKTFNAITFHSGTAYGAPQVPSEPEMISVDDAEPAPRPVERKAEPVPKPVEKEIEIRVPFPSRLTKKSPFEE